MPISRHISRRQVLKGTAVAAAGLVVPVVLPRPAGAAEPAAHEPSNTEVRAVDGTNVLFAYGTVVPSFDGWRTHEPTRKYLSLDRTWRFKFDPDNSGEQNGWQLPGTDDSDWDTIDVPSCWDLKDTPGFGGYDGSNFGTGTAFIDGHAWYRVDVAVPHNWRGNYVRLNSLGASYIADFWVNGTHLGMHEGGSTAFALPVGDAIRPGQRNVVVARVFRNPGYTSYDGKGTAIFINTAMPPGPCDYWPYAGLLRSVWLEAVPTATIAKLLVNAADGKADIRAIVENHGSQAVHGEVTIDPGHGRPAIVPVDVPAGGTAVVRANLELKNAPTWTQTHPNLLTGRATLRTAAGVDMLSASYGVRSITTAGPKLLLSGRQLFLKGTNWHEETPENGRSMTVAEYDTELGRIAAGGANFIRNCVYNRHPYVYDWADRHGMLVLDEYDTMWVHPVQMSLQMDSYGLSKALALTTAWNQHNHPSVIMWGVQNESERDANGAPIYRAWISGMRDAIKSVDLAQRPITWASATASDPAFEFADVLGFNEYFGYFTGKVTDLGPTLDAVHSQHPDKPILITENGSWAFPDNHGPADQAGTEEWQAGLFTGQWAQLGERSDFVAGYTLWVFKDYKERANYNQAFNGISELGMLTFDKSYARLEYSAFRDAAWPTGLQPW